jgi:hypothetical protein
MRNIVYCLTILFIYSCDGNLKPNNSSTNSIDKKYIEYLKVYQDPNDINAPHEIVFEQIGEKIYWVTYNHDAGTRQEYYWENQNNLITPKFIFEFGGENWEAELGYSFFDVKTSKTISGRALEEKIQQLKKDFIRQYEK